MTVLARPSSYLTDREMASYVLEWYHLQSIYTEHSVLNVGLINMQPTAEQNERSVVPVLH
jgi:hypothetical protein